MNVLTTSLALGPHHKSLVFHNKNSEALQAPIVGSERGGRQETRLRLRQRRDEEEN